MIKTFNIFSTNILPKIFIVKAYNTVFAVNILKKRRRTKLKYKKKSKKTTTIIINSPAIYNFFINFNKTIQYNKNLYTLNKKKTMYLLKTKIKWKFIKFKYRGKGFKIKKFNKLAKITFRLGKSHWTKLLYNKRIMQVKRTKKNSYCCVTIKNKTFDDFKSLILKIKGINKYTKRGVRLTRQLVKKRFGKISQASSVYN